MALTDKQERFVREYLVDMNAAAAYERAGYAARGASARTNASRLLTKANVDARLQELRVEQTQRLQLTSDMVAEEMRRVGFSDLRQVASWNPDEGLRWKSSEQIDDEAAAAIKDIQFTREIRTEKNGTQVETTNTNLKLHDKLGALKSLGQHLGMFGKDGANTGVNVNVGVNVNNKPPEERRQEFADLHQEIAAYRQGFEDGEHREQSTAGVDGENGAAD